MLSICRGNFQGGTMERNKLRFVGVELYFDKLEKAKAFYLQTLGLDISAEQVGHHAKFDGAAGFICLECKGAESYPSKDKAVLFFETPRLSETVLAIGKENLVQSESNWAVLHDPEGHNIVLLQSNDGRTVAPAEVPTPY
jgi:predicted enzyme related to lactoylglutathione lyase